MTEFLAELYLPRTAADAVAAARDRAMDAAAELSAEGISVRLDRTIFVPAEEMCLFLFEATSIEAVQEAARRAALSFEHIAEAVTDASWEHGHEQAPARRQALTETPSPCRAAPAGGALQ